MPVITDSFLLNDKVSASLYNNFARHMPIIDYHCHIQPKDIADDISYDNITQIWLYGDHYKWRAMRACGIPEKFITGEASDREKFSAYCRAMPKLIGNPLYHWSHLELSRYFGIDCQICPANEEIIWNTTSEMMHGGAMSAKKLIKDSRVEAICTTDDPCDTLEYHKRLACDKDFNIAVYPSFRPDKALNCAGKGYADYIDRLSGICGYKIEKTADLKAALRDRILYFVSLGMKTADHGIDDYLLYVPCDESYCDKILSRALGGERPDFNEVSAFRCHMLTYLASVYFENNIVMQLHIGVIRNPNSAAYAAHGADAGYDTIHGKSCISDLARLLDCINTNGTLPRTVLYSANQNDNAALDSLCCAFNRDGEVTIAHGTAWWFNDTYDGIRGQIKSLANLSALGSFIGMTTDSRSLLSYTRHEYFRRILCGLLGELVTSGQCPPDGELLGQLVCDICYNNVKSFFRF